MNVCHRKGRRTWAEELAGLPGVEPHAGPASDVLRDPMRHAAALLARAARYECLARLCGPIGRQWYAVGALECRRWAAAELRAAAALGATVLAGAA